MTTRAMPCRLLCSLLLFAAAAPAAAQVEQTVTTTLGGRAYEPSYVFFTSQGTEAVLNFSRVNGRCASTTACGSSADCTAFPGATCASNVCQVPVDALIGQVAVLEQNRFCELAACAGAAPAACGAATCPAGQTYCGSPGSCHTCPAAEALCLCDGGATCDATDAALGVTGVPFEDGFDDGANPSHWLLEMASIDTASLDTRLNLGPGAALPEGVSVAVAGAHFGVAANQAYVLVVKHAVNPRQTWAECNPMSRLTLFVTTRAPQWCDLDGDGFAGTDCNDGNSQVWAIPGEVPSVTFAKSGGVATLAWAQPSIPGGTPAATAYNIYGGGRSDLSKLLDASADSCLVATTPGLSTAINGDPSPGTMAWYLVRAGNTCGEGSAGSATAGPRIHDPRNCDDGIACTIDSCGASLGCVHTPNDAACADANPCTTDSCDGALGCLHANNALPCDDGSSCTTNDTCSAGACGGQPVSCDDGNICTDDTCAPASGCVHTNNTAPCDDGNSCTSGETCSNGSCIAALPNHLVISQIQTSGDGASSADDEFVELYNPTGAAIGLSGLSLQYKAATGTTYLADVLPALSVPSHGWFLIARSAYNGPTAADQVHTAFLMAASAGNLFLVNGTAALASSSCSTSASIIDKVAYGATANCPEGTTAVAPAANNSTLRKPGGSCGNGQDTNDNASDFQVQVPAMPRNRFSTPQP